MADVKMSNVKKRLSSCRKACPGLETGVYDLAFYMSLVANDELVPAGMALCLAMCLEDFKKEKCGFSNAKAESSLSSLIKRNKTQILAQAVYFPQIIDAIASEEFATEFRK